MTSKGDSGTHMAFDEASEVYRRLVAALTNGAVLFVGAGSSCRVGYPSWGRLLDQLYEAAKREDPDSHAKLEHLQGVDGLLRASEYRKALGVQRYHDELRAAFAPRTPQHDQFHESLVRLPFRHVLTTNYDDVLESAHFSVYSSPAVSFDVDEWVRLSEFRQAQVAPVSQRRYVHVHGSINRPDGIVLCREDYDARYVHETRARDFLSEILTGQRVVFVGFSLADEDLKFILRTVAGSLGLSQPRHFVLLPRPASPDEESSTRVNYSGKFHVEAMYFDNASGDYSSLVALVDALHEDVNAEWNRQQQKRYVDIEAVPSLVADLLPDQPELQGDLQHRLPGLLQLHAVPMTLEDAAGGTTDIDSAIDDVFRFVDRGLPDDAIREYETIRATRDPDLTAKQRYRLAANTGHALYSKGNTAAAAKAYIEAIGHYRESRDAQGLEILAHLLLGDTAEALRLAGLLCSHEPDYARARCLWVQSQPDNADFGEIEAEVAEDLRDDAEVALALSHLARRTGNHAAAELYARKAVSASPDWPDALTTFGIAIVMSEKDAAVFDVDEGYVPHSPERVREAERLFSAAIEHTPVTDPRGGLAGLYYNRSVAHRLRGDQLGAESDLGEAFRRDPGNSIVTLAYAMNSEAGVDIPAALRAIEAFPEKVPEWDQLQFARLWLLLRRGQSDDVQRAVNDIEALIRRLRDVKPSWLQTDIVRLGLRLLTELRRESECPAFVSNLPADVIRPHAMARFRGHAELLAGNRTQATDHAKEAIGLLGDDADWFDRREVALLAEGCGLHSAAIPVWESVLGMESTSSDTAHYVRCAFFAGEWKKLLEVCARLRAHGRLQREHMLAEVEVLANSRETNRALSILQEWLREHPSDKHVRLQLSTLALRQHRSELAESDEQRLPSVMDVAHAGEGAALVYVLRRGPTPHRALEVAYELYRRFPEHIGAHHALIACVFDPSAPDLEIERPTTAGTDTAVCIRREGDGESLRWIYVENGPDPAVTRDEYGESHELVTRLWEKRAGDRLEFQGHKYEVVGVENKILRRVHEVMEGYEENFPDTPFLRRFSVPKHPPPDASAEEAFGEVITELKRHAQHHERLESMYHGNQLPLTSFAKFMGRPVFDTVRYLALEPMLAVRAHTGDAREWPVVREWVRGGREIVLDATALASAHLLGLLTALPRLNHRFIVPKAVLDEVQEISLNAANRRGARHTIGIHQGRLFLHESSPEELAREVEALERVQRFVRDDCEVVGGEATLDLPAALRGQLEGLLGEAATDALALAKKRNAVLWTDDLGLQALAKSSDFGVRSAWTQAVLWEARDAGRISPSEYDKYVGKLVICGYAFTSLSARDMTALLCKAGWRVRSPLGSAVVRLVSDVALQTQNNCLITAGAFLLIWRQCPRRGLARDIVVAILDGIGRDRVTPLLSAVCRNPLPEFRDTGLRPLRRMLRSWRARVREFRPGRCTRRSVTRSIVRSYGFHPSRGS